MSRPTTDHDGSLYEYHDLVHDQSVSLPLFKDFLESGRPPTKHILVTFSNPMYGTSLLPESLLVLLDRSLSIGDVVKRRAQDAKSGTIIWASMVCTLIPSFPYDPLVEKDLSQNCSEDNDPNTLRGTRWQFEYPKYPLNAPLEGAASEKLHGIPGQELQLTDKLQEGSFIVYQGWLGMIEETFDQVTIRLADGSIVTVQDSAKLEIPVYPQRTEKELEEALSMKEVARRCGVLPKNQSVKAGEGRPNTIAVDRCAPGQFVVTNRTNLSRGTWKTGKYRSSLPPHGFVVDVNIIQVGVRWIYQKFPADKPPNLLDSDVLNGPSVYIYDRGKAPPSSTLGALSPIGYASGADLEVGDRVRFKDLAGAAVKYADGSHSRLSTIPQVITQGYDLNTFIVEATTTKVRILWQDMTITEEHSNAVLPYVNVDDHDVWPGEIVVVKDNPEPSLGSENDEGVFRPKKVGIVQAADASERIARIRWAADPKIELTGESKSILLPGSLIGALSDEIEDVSFYEIRAFSGLTKRRGDFVVITGQKPRSERYWEINELKKTITNDQELEATFLSSAIKLLERAGSTETARRLLHPLRNTMAEAGLLPNVLAAIVDTTNPQLRAIAEVLMTLPEHIPGSASANGNGNSKRFDWFGEIVDLASDGQIVVRLGALQNVQDVHIPIECVTVVSGSDEEDDDEGYLSYSTDGAEDGYSSSWSGTHASDAVIEYIEYEGGRRIDKDQGDEMWLTDEDSVDDNVEMSMIGNEAFPDSHAFDPESEQANTPDNMVAAGSADTSTLDEKFPLNSEHIIAQSEKSPLKQIPNTLYSTDYANGPDQFSILEGDAPRDHAFQSRSIDYNATRLRRIRKEHKILDSSLPPGIFVRTWDSRLDLLRVLIIGPRCTPYELAPFIIDFHFGALFPSSPPSAHFHSWTGGIGRVNPNLYEDGKICLSLLGTWPADDKDESWSGSRSSMLQILVSLMGLVLVKEPYYNEAGFDILADTEDSRVTSAQYTEKAYVLARGFVNHALQYPVEGFEYVLQWLYLPRQRNGPEMLREVTLAAKDVITLSEQYPLRRDVQMKEIQQGDFRISAGALVLLRRTITDLEQILTQAATKKQ
ncbi:MAG: hypothetical protein M1827_005259 [Pycnora praestabilis]|nr:MAG: hypothetical protein M1827_005259 [Pycnora praestabilis]